MKYDPEKHHRHSFRLKGYDYSQAGAYFITICTKDRACLFGEVVVGVMRLNQIRHIVWQCWLAIPEHVPHVLMDEFVVMPNHVHGIILIVATPYVGATHVVGTTHASLRRNDNAPTRPRGPQRQSVASIVVSFKSAVTKRINEHRGTAGAPVWQRNYFEHIIRNDETLNRIRECILNNPQKWELDRKNLVRTKNFSLQQKDNPWRI